MSSTVFIMLCLEGAILSFNFAASSAMIPSIASEFSVPQFAVGRIVWVYMLAYGAAAFFYGPLIRFYDARRVELSCFLIFCAANLLAGISSHISALILARFLMGLSGASVIPLALILLGRSSAADRRGRMVGIFFGSTFVASLLGLLLSGMIYWRLIFLIPAAAGLMLWLAMYFELPSFSEGRQEFKVNYLAAFRDKTIVLLFTYILLISLFYHGVQQWLAVYFADRYRLSQFAISMLITLTSLSGIFGEAVGGWLADIRGRLNTAQLGIAFMIVSVFLLIFKMPLVILGMVMIAWGTGWTFNHAAVSTRLTDLPPEFLNEAASLNSGVRFVSGGLGAALGGLIMQQNFSLGFMIFGMGLFSLAVFAKCFLNVR